jgi:hypothetical protein
MGYVTMILMSWRRSSLQLRPQCLPERKGVPVQSVT